MDKRKEHKTVFHSKDGDVDGLGRVEPGSGETQSGFSPGLSDIDDAVSDDMSNTMRFSRKALVGDIPLQQHACLEVHGVKDGPLTVDLGPEEINIGRSPDCTLHLPLNNVSRIHARIYCRAEEYYVEDLDSTNGTYLNNIRIVRSVLRNSDQIEIGEAKMIFVEDKTRSRQ